MTTFTLYTTIKSTKTAINFKVSLLAGRKTMYKIQSNLGTYFPNERFDSAAAAAAHAQNFYLTATGTFKYTLA